MVFCLSNTAPKPKNTAATKPTDAAANVYASCSVIMISNLKSPPLMGLYKPP